MIMVNVVSTFSIASSSKTICASPPFFMLASSYKLSRSVLSLQTGEDKPTILALFRSCSPPPSKEGSASYCFVFLNGYNKFKRLIFLKEVKL